MKTKKIFYTALIIALPFVWTSCSDILDVEPNDVITKENFYKTESDFQAATGPLYNKVWFDLMINFITVQEMVEEQICMRLSQTTFIHLPI